MRVSRVLVCLAVLCTAASVGAGGATASVAGASPPAGVQIGDYVGMQSRGGSVEYPNVAAFELSLGRTLAIDSHYVNWQTTNVSIEAKDLAAGRTPLIAWKAYGATTASAIASGVDDSQITATAKALAALPGTVYLRFAWEMDHSQIGTPAQTIAAWQHVYDLFHAVGATNVQFVWCVTARGMRSGNAIQYYPGDAYVDWIAVDGYNRYPKGSPWVDASWLFDDWYTWSSTHAKPLMIAESGSTEGASATDKATWLQGLGAWVASHPLVRAWVYNDTISIQGYDFRLDSSAAAFAAYKAVVAGSYFAARAS